MTNQNVRLATGFVGLVAAHTLLSLPLRKKKNSLSRDLAVMMQVNNFLLKQNDYLSGKLDENGIAPTAFDLIALNNPDLM